MASKSKEVDIKKAPTASVSGLSKPAFKDNGSKLVFTASWKYPKACFDKKKNDRFQGVMIRWFSDISMEDGKSRVKTRTAKKKVKTEDKKTGKTTTKTIKVKTEYVTNASKRKNYTLKKLTGSSKTKSTQKLTRSNFYPLKNVSSGYTVFNVYKALTVKRQGNKWKILKRKVAYKKKKSEINKAKKQGKIFTQSELVNWPANRSPKGKYYIVGLKKGTKVYPPYPAVDGVGVLVQGWNKNSVSSGKSWVTTVPVQAAYFNFDVPMKPSVSFGIGGEGSNFLVTASISSEDEKDTNKERYDTVYKATAKYSFYDGTKLSREQSTTVIASTSNTKRNFSFTLDPKGGSNSKRLLPTGYSGLGDLRKGEFITYFVEAYNRGIAGDSEVYKKGGKFPYITIARPHDAKIKESTISKKGGFCLIHYDLSGSGTRLTQTVTLQRLANWSPAGNGSDKPVDDWTDAEWLKAASEETSGWQDVYTIGANEKVFSDPAWNAYADPFKRTYYRVVPKNEIYMLGDDLPSQPVVVEGYLKIPSAVDQKIELRSAAPTMDGKAIHVVAVFNKTKTSDGGAYNSNGTEMSWSTQDYAWKSSSGPSTHDFMDDDIGPVLVNDDVYSDSYATRFVTEDHRNWLMASYYLSDVSAGEKYYIKGRRFLKETQTRESDSYGGYSDYSVDGESSTLVEVKSVPKDVKLTAPETLVEGHDLSVTWTYDSDLTQTHYSVFYSNAAKDGETFAFSEEYQNVENSSPYVVLKWADIEQKFAACQDTIYIGVQIRVCSKGTDDGEWSEMSNITTTKLQRRPIGEFNLGTNVMVSQPLQVSVGSTNQSAAVVLRIVAENATMGWGPMGQDNQASGSIIKSVRFVPNWVYAKDVNGTPWYEANYQFEPDLDFRNNADYRVDYTVIDEESNLRTYVVNDEGEQVPDSKTFRVEWENDIQPPVFYVVGDPVTEEHNMRAHITILGVSDGSDGYTSELSSAYDGVVADIYRVTPDGVYLLARGIEDWCGCTVTDKFPAYSKYNGTFATYHGDLGPDHPSCRYRVALRSPNVDTEWSDRTYSMNGYCIRFDWGSEDEERHGGLNHLVLPYNLKWSDSWTKNSRVELHLDGSYSGYWRGGVDRKNTMSTEIARFQGADQVARVRALAKHAGPVLVRLPDGCVFTADVQVSNLDSSFDSQTISASFSAQEINMDPSFSTASVAVEKGLYKPVLTAN